MIRFAQGTRGEYYLAHNIKNVKVPSYHSIMRTHANFNIFLIMVFWFKYIISFHFKIRILDLILLRKNSIPFEGLYYSSFVHVVNKSGG